MATVKVGGFKASKGMSGFTIPAGRYKLAINGVELKPTTSEKGSGTSWVFAFGIEDAPEECKVAKVSHSVWLPNEDHESAEATFGVDELKSIAIAADVVDQIKGDSIDPEVYVGGKLIAVVGLRKNKKTDADENTFRYEAIE